MRRSLGIGLRNMGLLDVGLLDVRWFRLGRRLFGPHQEIIAFGQNGRIHTRVSDDERRPWRQILGNLLTNLVGDLKPVEYGR